MQDLFLTQREKKKVSEWKYSVEDNSITTKLLSPLFDYVVNWISPNVAPNIITLMGLLCVIYAWYIITYFNMSTPYLAPICASVLIFIYQILYAVDGKHARRIDNSSPVGELFEHMCDNISVVFIGLLLLNAYNIENTKTQFYIIYSTQFTFLIEHCKALLSKKVIFDKYSGPGEALFAIIGLIILSPFIDLSTYCYNIHLICKCMYIISICRLGIFIFNKMVQHYETLIGLFIIILFKSIEIIMLSYQEDIHILHIISSGLTIAMVTSDIIVAKMANRDLHPLVVLLSATSLFNPYLGFVIITLYYFTIFYDITKYMNIPMFSVVQNIYVCGVFDMFHIGHQIMINNAQMYGNRVIVGIHSDEDVLLYKRMPITTHEERCDRVSLCNNVYKIIPYAPLITTKEFIEKHNIHLVGYGQEYEDKKDDHYYKDPREMGIGVILPRTNKISTSEIIKRIYTRHILNNNLDTSEKDS